MVHAGIAILGSGIFATEAYLPAVKALGPLAPTLKAVYSRTRKSASELADRAAELLHSRPDVFHDDDPSVDLDALLARSDIFAVILVLPIVVQPRVILKALVAGKHVLSEKPLAPDVTSGLALVTAYEAEYKPRGIVWRVAENWEAEPGFIAAAHAVRSGKIGKVIFFSAHNVDRIDRDSKWYRTPWRAVPEFQGGFMLDRGVHAAAALRVVLPSTLACLSGFASLSAEWLAPQDTIHAILKTVDGTHGTLELTVAAPPTKLSHPSTGNGIVVTGTHGHVTVDQKMICDPVRGDHRSVWRVTVKSVLSGNDETGAEREEVIDEPFRGVELELASFFAATLEGKEDGLGSPRGALRDVAVIEAALKSCGELVDLEKLVTQA